MSGIWLFISGQKIRIETKEVMCIVTVIIYTLSYEFSNNFEGYKALAKFLSQKNCFLEPFLCYVCFSTYDKYRALWTWV